MDRRGFLQGVFGGVTAAGVIVAASPLEIERFAGSLVRDEPVLLDLPPAPATHLGQHLYNQGGECVAVITDIKVTRDRIEVTNAFGGANRVYVPGTSRFTLTASGVGELVWDVDARVLRLVGVPTMRST